MPVYSLRQRLCLAPERRRR